MSSAVMPCCFEHRYSQLLEEGLVDDRTVLIDRDRLTFLEKENRSRGEIAKMYGVKKDDITRMKALERSLLVQERERAVSLLPPLPEAEIRAMEASEPDDSPDDSESEPKSESSEVVPDYSDLRKAIVTIMGPDPARPLHVQLMRAWCEVDGDDPEIYSVDSIRSIPGLIQGIDYGCLVMWSPAGMSVDDFRFISEFCDGHGIQLIFLGSHRELWEGRFPEQDGNTVEPRFNRHGRWMDFCWEHMRNANRNKISKKDGKSTRFAALEEVMTCARLAIPLWVTARAIGVATSVLSDALDDEYFLEAYGVEYSGHGAEVIHAFSDGADSDSEISPAPVVVESSEPVQPEEPASEPEDTTEVASQAPEDVFVVEAPAEAPVTSVSKDVRMFSIEKAANSLEDPEHYTVVRIKDSLITISGWDSIWSTVYRGAEPDQRIWTRSGDGWIIRSHRAWLAYRDGQFAYCSGEEALIRDAVYDKVDNDVAFDRDGLMYKQVGRLTLFLSDCTEVSVPVVSDVPVMKRRWLV